VKSLCEHQKLNVEINSLLSSESQDENMEKFLSKMSSRGQSYRACGYLDLNLLLFYRYSVTCDLGEGHLALGKVSNSSILSGEVTVIQEFVHIRQSLSQTAEIWNCLQYLNACTVED